MLSLILAMLVPLILVFVTAYGVYRKVDVYNAFLKGAAGGLEVLVSILPSLIGLLTAVYMLRASGALEYLAMTLAPFLDVLGVPSEVAPLMLFRPISGSGALGVGVELMETYGVDSYIGRCVAVMLGSTETTFYTIAVYFGAAGIYKTRYAIPAALCADLAGFVAGAFAVRLFF